MDHRPPGRLALTLAAGLLGAGWPAAPAAEPPPPIAWQEPAPVARLFLQLPLEPPELLAPGRLAAEGTLRYSNSMLLASNATWSLEADAETAAPSLLVRAGLARGLEARLQVAAVGDWGGRLDRPIDAVDRAFGAINPQRAVRPIGSTVWLLVRSDGRGVVRRGPEAGLADPWLGVKVALLSGDGPRPDVSLRAALALPLARPPFGAGILTPGAGLLLGWSSGRAALRLAVDLAVPTGRLEPVGAATNTFATAQVGASLEVSPRIALHLQGSGHGSPLHGTGLGQLDRPTWYVLAGATGRLAPGVAVDLAAVENVFSPYRGADIAFVLTVRTAPGG